MHDVWVIPRHGYRHRVIFCHAQELFVLSINPILEDLDG